MASLYEAANADRSPVLSPFTLAFEPMDRLLLANFTGDPDSVYVGFEPQAFDDAAYGIAGAGLHAMVERPFDGARFAIGETGPDVELTFDDLLSRAVRLVVRETNPDPSVGVVTGTWSVRRTGDTVRVAATPSGGWTPNEPNRTVRLIYRLGGAFTVWPASYRFDGVVTRDGDRSWRMRSGWERVRATPP